MSFWKKHITAIFAFLFVLISIIIILIDIKATNVFGFTTEEEIIFPVLTLLFIGFSLLIIKEVIFKEKSGMLKEFREMSQVSKIFAILSFFFITISIVLIIFQKLFLFNISQQILFEEKFVAIGMFIAPLIFLIVYSKEVLKKK